MAGLCWCLLASSFEGLSPGDLFLAVAAVAGAMGCHGWLYGVDQQKHGHFQPKDNLLITEKLEGTEESVDRQ
jgi:hypothetical protein